MAQLMDNLPLRCVDITGTTNAHSDREKSGLLTDAGWLVVNVPPVVWGKASKRKDSMRPRREMAKNRKRIEQAREREREGGREREQRATRKLISLTLGPRPSLLSAVACVTQNRDIKQSSKQYSRNFPYRPGAIDPKLSNISANEFIKANRQATNAEREREAPCRLANAQHWRIPPFLPVVPSPAAAVQTCVQPKHTNAQLRYIFVCQVSSYPKERERERESWSEARVRFKEDNEAQIVSKEEEEDNTSQLRKRISKERDVSLCQHWRLPFLPPLPVMSVDISVFEFS